MGLETALIAGTLISATGSIISGVQQNKEAKRQAALQEEETRMAAAKERKEAEIYRSRQAVAYLKSGVAIDAGSPLLAMQETLDTAANNARNIERMGAERANLLRKQGRNALMGGYIGALGSAAGGYSSYKVAQSRGYIGGRAGYSADGAYKYKDQNAFRNIRWNE